ncbi:hypothetical protein [Faecalibacter macacae]|uniref:Uncharacterized protein n=1 Tax=Faecalibacter macacae TaxID=1859289 RepID=A0A3L9M9J1_9FLAO|nr:hypothetical protein [Faecalibacter macacae]RLZ09725.1 hypothetical protein EAH69_08025 [Faecalibacter macacae]
MIDLNKTNLPKDLAIPVQNFISNAVCRVELLLVFYTAVGHSKLKIITLVVDKQNYDALVDELQSQVNALHALEKYDTLITINYHSVSSNDSHFHFSYLQLHLQPCYVIYSNHLKRWNSLFQNIYTTDKQKAKIHYQKYTKEVENKVHEAISMFVAPLVKQQLYEAAHLALFEVFSYYFDLLKNMLLPSSLHHKYNEQEFILFIDAYYHVFSKIVYKISKIKEVSFIDQSQYILGETPKSIFDKTMKSALEILTHGFKRTNIFYTKRIDAQLPDRLNEKTLLKNLVTFLIRTYKIDSIYLLSTEKINDSNGTHNYKFNLLIIAPTLRIQQHDALVQKVSNHFKGKVEVLCLIHTLEWLQKNEETFQHFINKYILHQNVLFMKSNLVLNKKHCETTNTKQLQEKYWTERLAYISPWFTAFQQQNLVYQNGHILLLKNILQQLILGILYQKLQYIPAIYSSRYLMQLFQSLLPEIYNKCIDSIEVQTILHLLSTPIDFLPNINPKEQNIDQLTCAKTLGLCEKLFNEIQLANN